MGSTLRLALPISRKALEKRIENEAEALRGCDAAFLFGCRANHCHWGEMGPIYYMYLSRKLGQGFAGFHADGEIAPCAQGYASRLQNQSLTLVTLTQRDG